MLQQHIPAIRFRGASADLDNSLYSVLNVGLPSPKERDLLLVNLDLAHIAASGGSACTSGTEEESHVQKVLSEGKDDFPSLRFSFAHTNTKEEIEYVVDQLALLCQ